MRLYKLIVICLIFYGCSDDQKTFTQVEYKKVDGGYNKIIFYEGGKDILSITSLNIDSIPNGKETYFYRNGVDSLIINWENGKKVGEKISFYENGSAHKYQFIGLNNKIIYERGYNFFGDSVIYEFNELTTMNVIEVYKYKEENKFEAKIYLIKPPKVKIEPQFYLVKLKDTLQLQYLHKENLFSIKENIRDSSYSEFIVKLSIVDSLKSIKWTELNVSDLNSMYYPYSKK